MNCNDLLPTTITNNIIRELNIAKSNPKSFVHRIINNLMSEKSIALTSIEGISYQKQSINKLSSSSKTNSNHLDQDTSKPSQRGSAKSEIIRLELETIIQESPPEIINRDTLWHAICNKAGGTHSRFKKHGNKIIEKDTGIIWDREKANYHLNKVIGWYKSITNKKCN
jgi:hypothetical protein